MLFVNNNNQINFFVCIKDIFHVVFGQVFVWFFGKRKR